MFISKAIEYGAAMTSGQRNEAVAFSVETFIKNDWNDSARVIASVMMTATGDIAYRPQTPEVLAGIY